MQRLQRAIARVVDWADRYQRWYQNSMWGDFNLPRCPFCNSHRSKLRHGTHRLTNYRYQHSRVVMRVYCTNCGGTMNATQQLGSKSWTYYDS